MSANCFIYRCSRKPDMYVYLAEENDFDCINKSIKNSLGELTFALALELNRDTKLVKEDPEKVLANLQSQKFHLQLPPQTSIESLMAKISK